MSPPGKEVLIMEVKNELVRFSRNVHYLRKKNGYTQKDMAIIMHICVGSLRKLEKGMIPKCITAETLYLLCKHFHISADLILNEEFES